SSLRLLAGRITLEDCEQLFHERAVAHLEPADLIRVAVVEDTGRNRREKPHRGRDQRLGDMRRDDRDRRALQVTERVERAHDPPDGAEEADIRARVADRSEEREIALEPVHLSELRDVHRAPRALDDLVRRKPFLPQTPELAKARLEDPGHALRRLLARDL